MKAESFSAALGEIDERYLAEALDYRPKPRRLPVGWMAMAACLLLALSLALPRRSLVVDYGGTALGASPVAIEQPLSPAAFAAPAAQAAPAVQAANRSVLPDPLRIVLTVPDGTTADDPAVQIDGTTLLWTIDCPDSATDYQLTLRRGWKTGTLHVTCQDGTWTIRID